MPNLGPMTHDTPNPTAPVGQWRRCMIYGAYGYTGELTARLCRRRGLKPILAGRSAEKLEALATEVEMPYRVVGLDDGAALDAALADVDIVIHCAGPFSRTAEPMVDACMRTATHYLDITGELAVFERCAARDAEARAAGIMVMPGTGFDVVPTDCLAAHLKRRLPSATKLELAFKGIGGGMSRGTATTTVENLSKPSVVRRGGELTEVRSGSMSRQVDFGRGPRHTMGIPWGDVSTAWHSTKIPDISVYTAVPRSVRYGVLASSFVRAVFALRPVQRFLKARVNARPAGPSAAQRDKALSVCWGRVEDDGGGVAEATLKTPEGYTLTARASLDIARRVLQGDFSTGYQTPSSAYGPDLILDIDGTERVDTV